jgi:hypothetical protein
MVLVETIPLRIHVVDLGCGVAPAAAEMFLVGIVPTQIPLEAVLTVGAWCGGAGCEWRVTYHSY